MAFPIEPTDGQVYTNESGIRYIYNLAENMWKMSQPVIHVSETEPGAEDGKDGDIWFVTGA